MVLYALIDVRALLTLTSKCPLITASPVGLSVRPLLPDFMINSLEPPQLAPSTHATEL